MRVQMLAISWAVWTIFCLALGCLEYILENCPSLKEFSKRILLGLAYQYAVWSPLWLLIMAI